MRAQAMVVRGWAVVLAALVGEGCLLIERSDLLDWGACVDPESADSGFGSDTAVRLCDDGGADDDAAAVVNSCDWPDSAVCYEFSDQSGVEEWCAAIGAANSLTTTYALAGCPTAQLGTCTGLTGGDLGSLTATAHYFGAYAGDPQEACTEGGGDYSPG
ncbi:MAG: hypothetical protein JNM72_14055 [Deltaproteobacteria bacterium]|nr:hypothetical protein [Deltaproteobacteria bacterium]